MSRGSAITFLCGEIKAGVAENPDPVQLPRSAAPFWSVASIYMLRFMGLQAQAGRTATAGRGLQPSSVFVLSGPG